MFGFPDYLHCDQGPSFMFYKLKSWLHSVGISTSKSKRYNPQRNEQVERMNRNIWQTVQLALSHVYTGRNQHFRFLIFLLCSLHRLLTSRCKLHKKNKNVGCVRCKRGFTH